MKIARGHGSALGMVLDGVDYPVKRGIIAFAVACIGSGACGHDRPRGVGGGTGGTSSNADLACLGELAQQGLS